MTLANRTGISGVRARRVTTTALVAAACALSVERAHAEPFTLVVMPDTQSEATNTPQLKFPAITQWIVDNRAARNIRFVAHVGDLVNWDTPFSNPPHFQYVNASAAMEKLDRAAIPYAIAVGNHDTAAVGGVNPDGTPCYCGGSAGPGNTHINVRNTSVLNQFFPLTRFAARAGQYEPNKMDNTYHLFTAGGLDWLVLSTELDPRPGALAWFNQVVSSHPNHNVIYVTHNYLAPSGNLAGGVGYGDLAPQAIWDGLIKLHPNIRFVLSGHLTQTALRQTAGNSGQTVYQVLTDYQDDGNGWLRTLEIDPAVGTVKSQVYSPYLRQYKSSSTEQFTLTNVRFVPRATTDAPNIARGKPTTASSTENTTLTAASATDGNTATRWSSAFSDPQWIRVDLGQTYAINRVTLNWETAYGRAYQLQTSSNGSTWTTLYSTASGDGKTDDLTVNGTGRYLRVYGTARGTQWGYSLWELSVNGTAVAADTVSCDGNAAPAGNLSFAVFGFAGAVLLWTRRRAA